MPATEALKVKRFWSPVQSAFLRAEADRWPYVDMEGAVRSGKSTALVHKLMGYCLDYPGITTALTRWTQDALDAQVKPLWRSWCHQHGVRLQWHADEEYDEVVGTGSRVYLRALKGSEETSRYGKLAGLTLAILAIDQPEEVPEDVYRAYVPTRLSQPGYPHQVLLTPNPPGLSHWLAAEFPERNSTPGHLYLRVDVYSNRHNLGDRYIAELETAYPEGSALRRRFIEGKRGLPIIGKPVYAGVFQSRLHVLPQRLNPDVPLLEGWDFGHSHPAVVWAQVLPWGEFRVLGGLLGTDQFIEDFAPMAVAQRHLWFGGEPDDDGLRTLPCEVWSTGDPAGDQNNSQGTRVSAADVLREYGVNLYTIAGANHPDARDRCIQHVAGYMQRLTKQGPAFLVDPTRWRLNAPEGVIESTHFIDALEAGYVWDERKLTTAQNPNTRRARKDGFYDHSMNGLEYIVLAYGPAQPTKVDHDKEQARARQLATRDHDEADLVRTRTSVRYGARYGGTRGRR